jgi:hypothetical protein
VSQEQPGGKLTALVQELNELVRRSGKKNSQHSSRAEYRAPRLSQLTIEINGISLRGNSSPSIFI